MTSTLRLGAGLLAAVMICCGAANAETRVSLAAGVEYSSGDYGEPADTEATSIPLSARISTGDWAFRAAISYLSVSGPADIVAAGEGGAPSGPPRMGTEEGFGDTTLSVTRSLSPFENKDHYLDLIGRVRLPTGDEDKGLGVGATDYIAAAELGTSGRKGGAYISAGRRFLGDDDFQRHDGWQAGIGGWINPAERWRLGAYYSWRDASVRGNDDPSEAGAYISYRINDDLRIALDASGGLSESSPDVSVGVKLTWRVDRPN